jgi:MoaA/NifB/PqqE/SkfB family radical SAM enzyme
VSRRDPHLSSGTGPTGSRYRVLQIHPTRRCNLRCLHCYSSSSPDERDQLEVGLVLHALADAKAEGFNVAGFSGGEPLLYKPLRQALAEAQRCGMTTTVTSNGMLLTARRLEMLRGALDLLAISLDGVPTSHNKMRASERAFASMASHLQEVRRSGIPFGFIFTLTQYNLDELEWVARFALEEGASLLQIHPLEIVGRAKQELPDSRPDETEAAYAFLMGQRIQELAKGRMRVQVDFVHRRAILEDPERIFAGADGEGKSVKLADMVSPVVIEPDGAVVPIQYGFDRAYALGNLNDASLREMATTWRHDSYARFRNLCQRAYEDLTKPAELPFTNWYETIGQMAERSQNPQPTARSS